MERDQQVAKAVEQLQQQWGYNESSTSKVSVSKRGSRTVERDTVG